MHNNLGRLFQFELKKLAKRKLLWITALVSLLCIGFTVTSGLFGTYYVEGEPVETHYQIFKTDQVYRKALSGRDIDQKLIQETVDAYMQIPVGVERYTLTQEYQTYARPYSDIFNLIRYWTGMELADIRNWEVDEDTLYIARTELLEKEWQAIPLTESEKEFWRNKENQMQIPFSYHYHEGYEIAMDSFLTIGVVMLFLVAICLSSVFSEEHTRRTDQLMVSSAKGKTTAYWAKILAGITISVAAATLMSLTTIFLCLSIFGAEGFGAPMQIYFTTYSYPLTMGEACLIAYGIIILTSNLAGVFVMVLSELLHSGVATLAISSGLIILGGMISMPVQYRILAQIWDWSPMAYLSTWNVFDPRTLTLFGQCFTSWQVVPAIYMLLSVVLAVGGKYIYQRYQVSGR
ncbi:MAG: hypothetical protein IJZ34_15950 [Lachnospiraceae bacterium]|nr:hypothetical protein [Lachnospiraceae bacterium]